MSTKFAQNVLKELNKFRTNPKSIQHQVKLLRKGFSRLRAKDPFLKEIDYFVEEVESMNTLPALELNEVLTEAAKKELPNFRGKPGYKKYRRTDNIRDVIPDYYMKASPAMVADDGADEPINVLTKVLLDKEDLFKEGRNILCDPKFTQVGIAHEVFEEENMVLCIFASGVVEDEPEYDIPKADLTELKKAFDILDAYGKQQLDMKEIMKSADEMHLYSTNPTLYSIFKGLSDSDKCSWSKFANYVNKKMSDRKTKEGLGTIFRLFIDDPDRDTLGFNGYKKICSEINSGLNDEQIKDVIKASTNNGNELTYKEFEEYMRI